jgi:hypothetical protein
VSASQQTVGRRFEVKSNSIKKDITTQEIADLTQEDIRSLLLDHHRIQYRQVFG